MSNLSKIEFEILDSLAIDWECIFSLSTPSSPDISKLEIVDCLQHLFNKGYIQLPKEIPFNRDALLSEPQEEYWDTKYWFGLTDAGCKTWEDYLEKNLGSPVDWSRAWNARLNYKKEEGYVVGTTKKVCLKAFEKLKSGRSDFRIRRKLLKHSTIPGFDATYYKYISGGHRIDFKLQRLKKS